MVSCTFFFHFWGIHIPLPLNLCCSRSLVESLCLSSLFPLYWSPLPSWSLGFSHQLSVTSLCFFVPANSEVFFSSLSLSCVFSPLSIRPCSGRRGRLPHEPSSLWSLRLFHVWIVFKILSPHFEILRCSFHLLCGHIYHVLVICWNFDLFLSLSLSDLCMEEKFLRRALLPVVAVTY